RTAVPRRDRRRAHTRRARRGLPDRVQRDPPTRPSPGTDPLRSTSAWPTRPSPTLTERNPANYLTRDTETEAGLVAMEGIFPSRHTASTASIDAGRHPAMFTASPAQGSEPPGTFFSASDT